MRDQKLFPVMLDMRTVAYVPFSLVKAHERQALRNHMQTVERLADRGGLDCTELAAVLEDREWRRISPEEAWVAIWNVCLPASAACANSQTETNA